MTLNDLEKEVICLGFENGIDNENLLITCTNRALKILFRELPQVQRRRLYKRADMPRAYAAEIYGRGGDTVSLFGKAYSFRISGTGSYTVSDKNGRGSTISFDGIDVLCRGFADGGEISFSSDYPFTILDFACYSEADGPDVSDIKEYSKYERYDMSLLFEDFLSFCNQPQDAKGRTIAGSLTEGAVVLIPREYSGEINLIYERAPREITIDDAERDIDMTAEMKPLLPLLTSAFLWLDDDWDKSQYYLSLYKDTLSAVWRAGTRELGAKYTTNGWA